MHKKFWICLDGGTTNTRATLMVDGKHVDTISMAVGVRNADDTANSPVKVAISHCLFSLKDRHNLSVDQTPVLASGMLGSDAGLVNVPHLVAPVTFEMSCRSPTRFFDESVWPREITIFPGIKTMPLHTEASVSEHASTADIMRGEEVQAWGLRHLMQEKHPEILTKPWLLLWPGSHTKLISVQADGTIAGSFTTLAGELFAALKSATLLRRSLPESMPSSFPKEIMNECSDTVLRYGLLRAAFWTRVADLSNRLDENQRAAWLSSAVIAADIQGLSRHSWLCQSDRPNVFIGGDSTRQKIYRHLLERQTGIKATCIDPMTCENSAAIGVSLLAGLIQS